MLKDREASKADTSSSPQDRLKLGGGGREQRGDVFLTGGEVSLLLMVVLVCINKLSLQIVYADTDITGKGTHQIYMQTKSQPTFLICEI